MAIPGLYRGVRRPSRGLYGVHVVRHVRLRDHLGSDYVSAASLYEVLGPSNGHVCTYTALFLLLVEKLISSWLHLLASPGLFPLI